MLGETRFREIVAECLPDLTVTGARLFGEGWDFELWEANGDLLFRFPKRAESAEALVGEARLLVELTDSLATPVPKPELISDGCPSMPMPFFAYRKLAGQPLRTDPEDGRLGSQVGSFLTELHGFSVERAATLGVPCFTGETWRAEYVRFREQAAREVTRLLTPGEQAIVETFWEDFLGDDRSFRFRPVLIHADLGLEHLLVDEQRARLTGVIDFGDARVGDPALDFVIMTGEFGHAAYASYEGEVDEAFHYRAQAYLQIGPFHEVIYGQETNQPEFVHSGLEGIRARIVRVR